MIRYESFGENSISYGLAAKALAQFQRTMISSNFCTCSLIPPILPTRLCRILFKAVDQV